jgi:hypothetical protein
MALCKTKAASIQLCKKESQAGRALEVERVRVHANKFSISIRAHTPQKRGAHAECENKWLPAAAAAIVQNNARGGYENQSANTNIKYTRNNNTSDI